MTVSDRTRALLLGFCLLAFAAPAPARAADLSPSPTTSAASALASDTRVIVKFREVPAFSASPEGILRSASPGLDGLLHAYEVEGAAPLFARAGSPAARAAGLDRYRVLRARRPFAIDALLERLRSLPSVELAEPDYVASHGMAGRAAVIPDDPDFATLQWPLRNTGTQAVDPTSLPIEAGADIRAVSAWETTTGDSSVVVAVIDTGIRFDHPEFAGRIWTNPDEIADNDLDDDGNGFVDDVHGPNYVYPALEPRDDNGHGTACASIIGASANNGRQMAGLDWSCRLMPIKVLGQTGVGFISNIAAALVYAADEGADVVSMSLGTWSISTVLAQACEYAHGQGVFLAAAMMNENTSQISYPAGYDAWVTAVGGSDPADDRCWSGVCGYGSNYGAHIDVMAPGVSVPILSYADPSALWSGAGTSFATPFAAGLASLLLARAPGLAPDQVRDVMRYSADDLVGRPEEDLPGFDVYHGFGRINCDAALALAGSASFPVVHAPESVRTPEGVAFSFEVSVTDADGDPVDSLWVERGVLPDAARFTTSEDRARGTFAWATGYRDAGPYEIVFVAVNPFRAEAPARIEVVDVPDPPLVAAPTAVFGVEGSPLAVDVTATDPDGDPLTSLTASPIPEGALFTVEPGFGSGRLSWTPGFRQAGGYPIVFRATSLDPAGPLGDPLVEWGEIRTFVRVQEGPNQPPVVTVAAEVNGAEGEPLVVPFEVSDPDGDEIVGVETSPLPAGATLSLGEGNATGSIRWTPGYEQAGVHSVTLSAWSAHRATPVSEPELQSGSASLSFVIAERERPYLAATAFPEAADRLLRLLGAKPAACIRIEPEGGAYANEAVDPASLTLRAAEGAAGETLAALPAKTIVAGDRDRDGVDELPACFSKEGLRRLLASLPPGRRSVAMIAEGALTSGERLRASFHWDVIAAGGSLASSVTPSPMRRVGTLSFRTARAGAVRVRLFDVSGRLVRVLLDDPSRAAGYHDVALDARDASGERLRSGIYYYRIESPDGPSAGKMAIVR
jgi:subtilisin family serine protease